MSNSTNDTHVVESVMAAAGFGLLHSCGHPVGDHAAFRNRVTRGFPCHFPGCQCEGTDLD